MKGGKETTPETKNVFFFYQAVNMLLNAVKLF